MVGKKEEAEVTPAETAEAEVTQAPTVETLQSEIAKLTGQVEEAKREAKAHQEYGRKTKEELDRQKQLGERVEAISDRLDVTTQMLADLVDRGGEEELETPRAPAKRRSEDYLSRLKDSETKRKESEQQKWARLANEADGLLKPIGLEMDKSPETRDAYIKFLRYEPEAGLEEVRRIVEQKKAEANPKEPSETEAEKIDRLAEEKARRMLEEKGLLQTELSVPSAGSASFQEFEKRFNKGEIPLPVYMERARKEGKI